MLCSTWSIKFVKWGFVAAFKLEVIISSPGIHFEKPLKQDIFLATLNKSSYIY